MFGHPSTRLLRPYCDGELPEARARRVEDHLRHCPRCLKEVEALRRSRELLAALPRLAAPDPLWSRIERTMAEAAGTPPRNRARVLARRGRLLIGVAIPLLLCVSLGLWRHTHPSPHMKPGPFWAVTRLAGVPVVGSERIRQTGRLGVGQWLETDASSRAGIEVADIGSLEIDPRTRVRLLETDARRHRLELQRGTLHARISAPPRLFFVETPAAVAIDQGCAYTLSVDDSGNSLLRVTLGEVELMLKGRAALVPAGAACETRPGIGPGTPFFEDAPDAMKRALERLDFAQGGEAALDTVLASARRQDTLTLWNLLLRVPEADRGRVFDRLVAIVPLPRGVTRDGALRLDPGMLDLWKADIEADW